MLLGRHTRVSFSCFSQVRNFQLPLRDTFDLVQSGFGGLCYSDDFAAVRSSHPYHELDHKVCLMFNCCVSVCRVKRDNFEMSATNFEVLLSEYFFMSLLVSLNNLHNMSVLESLDYIKIKA